MWYYKNARRLIRTPFHINFSFCSPQVLALFIFTALRAFRNSFLAHWPWKAPFERFWAIIGILTACKTCYKKWYRPNRYRKIRYAFEIAADLFLILFRMQNNFENRSAAISKRFCDIYLVDIIFIARFTCEVNKKRVSKCS